MLVATLIAGIVVVLATRTEAPPPPTARRPLGATVPPIALKRALLNPADIPGSEKWTVASDFGGFSGFSFLAPCGKTVDTSSIAQEQFSLFEGQTTDGKDGRIFQAVAEFKDEGEAKRFMQSIPSLISCGTWTDDQGNSHNAVSQKVTNPAGEDSAIIEDILKPEDGSTTYDHDYAFYRQGRFVGFVTNLVEKQNDKNFTEDLLAMGVQQLQKASGG